ncbi:hypothetical protein BDY21DRAFT_351976 [Lineolata rhizophorae]|uniref:Uncharacterized protein n=1 Tax=Lineolata rhizophorae TaxID=578093 RepID=A0A6A6NT13_9PEZI|nr:hypothetical protein BDY21DRAFT_351976 [Lineolata rhizophorae]
MRDISVTGSRGRDERISHRSEKKQQKGLRKAPLQHGVGESIERRKRRVATLYDAVAGRVGTNGFLKPLPLLSAHRDTISRSRVPIPPDEVLFKRKHAPIRYQEDDFYWADSQLDPQRDLLPDSHLVKAVHAYASDFANAITLADRAEPAIHGTGSRGVPGRSRRQFRSLDETALLAMSILLEETVKERLGKTGDLALTEGSNRKAASSVWDDYTLLGCMIGEGGSISPTQNDRLGLVKRKRTKSHLKPASVATEPLTSSSESPAPSNLSVIDTDIVHKRRKPKRRRVGSTPKSSITD